MSVFVLVHGAWHGAWCWNSLIPRLEAAGHRAIAVDLPGHGDDMTPAGEVTLQSYAQAVCSIASVQDDPVILVGHSMGGIAISQAAEQCRENVIGLVYLAAFLLRDGESLTDVYRRDDESELRPRMERGPDRFTSAISPQTARETLYPDAPAELAQEAMQRLAPDPNGPAKKSLYLTPGRYGRVPRVYIECLRDKAISLFLQRQMYRATPCQEVLSLDTDHFPLFSAPGQLVAALERAAAILVQQAE